MAKSSSSEGAEKSGDEKDEQGVEIATMAAGDYMIHVLVMKGKNFKDSEGAQTINAMFQVKACGKQEFSESKADCPTDDEKGTYWGEHMFFDARKLDQDDIQAATIDIRLTDKGFFRDRLIGNFEIDAAQIYAMEDHALQNQWIALNNPEGEDPSEIKAYCKVSIAIQGPGDSSVKLEESQDIEGQQQKVMMPPSVKKIYKQIKIGIIKAEGIPDMDNSILSDYGLNAYVSTEWARRELKTKVIDRKKGVLLLEFNQIFQFGVQWPMAHDRLVLHIMDEDTLSGDDAVGSINLRLKEIVKHNSNPGGRLRWAQIYGAPPKSSNSKVAAHMNVTPESASNWNGRVLLHIEVFDSKFPEFGVIDADLDHLQRCAKAQAFDSGRKQQYSLMAEVGAGICLPRPEKMLPYHVKIRIQDREWETSEPKQVKCGFNRWNERFGGIDTQFEMASESIEDLGTIFFYLVDPKGKQVCYWKGQAKEFTNKDPKYKWYPLTNDKAINRVKELHQAGMISLKLSIAKLDEENMVDWKQFFAWKKRPPNRWNSYQVRLYIFQCKDLPAADADGSSDPYVSIFNPEGADPRTKAVNDSVNPLFYHTSQITYDFLDIESAPPIVLDCYDSDTGLLDSSDDFLGRATIHLRDAAVAHSLTTYPDLLNTPPQPKWHDFKAGMSQDLPSCGQILCSFSVVESDFVFDQLPRELNIAEFIETKEYNVDINVLGLRELASFGMLPVSKAFIKFNTRGMLPPELAQTITNVQTEPKNPGKSPNINTTISVCARLPSEELYCPKLTCDVFDNVCRGLSQPKLGTFAIPIGTIMHQRIRDHEELMQHASSAIDFLSSTLLTARQSSARRKLKLVPFGKGDADNMIGTLVADLMKDRKGYQQRRERFEEAARSRATDLEASGFEDERSLHLSDGYSMDYNQLPVGPFQQAAPRRDLQLDISRISATQRLGRSHRQDLVDFQFKGTLESEASEADQGRKNTPQAMLGELDDAVNSLAQQYRRADQQMLAPIAQGSSSSPSSHYLPDVLSTFRESIPSQEEAVNVTHLAYVDPLLDSGAQLPPGEARGVSEQASQDSDSAFESSANLTRAQLEERRIAEQSSVHDASRRQELSLLEQISIHRGGADRNEPSGGASAIGTSNHQSGDPRAFAGASTMRKVEGKKLLQPVNSGGEPDEPRAAAALGSQHTHSDSNVTFSYSTQGMKDILEDYILDSQMGLEKEEAETERKQMINAFKKALFAKCERRRGQGETDFIEFIARLKARRRANSALNADQAQANHRLLATERQFLEHLMQNKKNMRILEKKNAVKLALADEIKLLAMGLHAHQNILKPRYAYDSRLKVQRETQKPPKSMYYPLGFDQPRADGQAPEVPVKHYRKFYDDELENNTEIFNRQPFHKFTLTRGQSRGLSKGIFGSLFGGGAQDESGFESSLKEVGYFKGRIEAYNEEDKRADEIEAAQKFKLLEGLVKEVHIEKYGTGLEFKLSEIKSREEKFKLQYRLTEMDCYSEDLLKFFTETSCRRMLQAQLMAVEECQARLYLLEGFDFASRDLGSFSDPYCVITCGDKVYSGRNKYQLDEPNPKFFEVYEFSARFPGAHPIVIEAYDFDDLFGDDLIGKTSIDLDDRQFCPEWKSIAHKPIEYRELYHPSTSLAQGTILCWVDIFDQASAAKDINKLWDISPEPSEQYQLRLSIYNTENVPMCDSEGTSDVFVKAWLDEAHQKETDTHWRCTTGAASFNYRMLFDFKSPSPSRVESEAYKLKLQIYDRDLLASNDFICGYELDLRLLVDDCRLTQKAQHLNQKYYKQFFRENYNKVDVLDQVVQAEPLELEWEDEDSFWLTTPNPEAGKKPIRIRIDVRILPEKLSQASKVGEARGEPNNSPDLPPPVGRMKLSLNPFAMLAQMVGPDMRNKIMAAFACLACAALILALLPIIAGNIASAVIMKALGVN